MNILVIGRGGREHAIAKKLQQEDKVKTVYCAPGNPGMNGDNIRTVPINEEQQTELIQFAKDNQIDWTFVGPETPLIEGIVDAFQEAGLLIFGPTKAAAIIEGSKSFAKDFMRKYQIPTADYRVFQCLAPALEYIEQQGVPIVIKADGLAAGKGVVVAETKAAAKRTLVAMMEDQQFGASGQTVVIEEFLQGEEFSLMAFVSNEKVYPMVIAQDHKRIFDGDIGPNTGGMGAYTPVPQIPEEAVQQAISQVLKPTAKGMVNEKRPFQGILYAGLIQTATGPKVIEFNARFGDPETQVVLARLESPLSEIISSLLTKEQPTIEWNELASIGVVVAAEGYPNQYKTSLPLPKMSGETIYYAGVARSEQSLASAGGRIFLVEATASTLEEARKKVYQTLDNYSFPGMYFRKDIGLKGLV
ncbi:phosphoribosylamine--glycine ligase [Enterococcus faecalis]|uniref:phosphoribosylamine--glycine ligase n=1 Tax=Enterococcus faecalis TaxID=1351 RepID=UPI002453DE99|nr:phosphoribosylamine--glycine ligase [Enterococcus faecalis]MDH5040242.1 phosphoribosylamine--glycine ligase [Enterococcus faecalis]